MPFESFIVLVGLVALVVVALMQERGGRWPVEPRQPLTQREQALYFRLVKTLPMHVVLAQVPLSRLMDVKRMPKRQKWLNKIDKKSVDFVVCDKSFAVLAVIELDDSTHAKPRRKKADADKQAALHAAGYRLVRWNSLPDEGTILETLPRADSIAVESPVGV